MAYDLEFFVYDIWMKVDGSFSLDLARFWSHNGYSILRPSHLSAHGHFMDIFLVVIAFPFKIAVAKCKLSDFSSKKVVH